MRNKDNIQVHYFDDTGEAYDDSQCRDDIEMGDVLVVKSEKVVGFLLSAWPCAVTVDHGKLHAFTKRTPDLRAHEHDTRDWSPYYHKAIDVAEQLGYTLAVDRQ